MNNAIFILLLLCCVFSYSKSFHNNFEKITTHTISNKDTITTQNSPLYIYNTGLDLLEENMLQCMTKKYFSIDCLSCGIQRSIILCLRGEFRSSFYEYPPLILIIFMISFLLLNLQLDFKNSHRWILLSVCITITAMIINFIYKLI